MNQNPEYKAWYYLDRKADVLECEVAILIDTLIDYSHQLLT